MGYSLESFGITKKNLTSGLKLSLIVSLSRVPSIIVAVCYYSHTENFVSNILFVPLIFPLFFVIALAGPAITEEFFFRAVLLERIAILLKSGVRATLVVAVLNGLYHLPFAYFLSSWPTHGNFLWAFSVVITEQTLGAIVSGILWIRTRNLASSTFFHAFTDALSFSLFYAALR
jgi:membrane protease YdiL (CAAX protease family)